MSETRTPLERREDGTFPIDTLNVSGHDRLEMVIIMDAHGLRLDSATHVQIAHPFMGTVRAEVKHLRRLADAHRGTKIPGLSEDADPFGVFFEGLQTIEAELDKLPDGNG